MGGINSPEMIAGLGNLAQAVEPLVYVAGIATIIGLAAELATHITDEGGIFSRAIAGMLANRHPDTIH